MLEGATWGRRGVKRLLERAQCVSEYVCECESSYPIQRSPSVKHGPLEFWAFAEGKLGFDYPQCMRSEFKVQGLYGGCFRVEYIQNISLTPSLKLTFSVHPEHFREINTVFFLNYL